MKFKSQFPPVPAQQDTEDSDDMALFRQEIKGVAPLKQDTYVPETTRPEVKIRRRQKNSPAGQSQL